MVFFWADTYKPTSWVPSETMFTTRYIGFPYVLASRDDKNIIGFSVGQITDEEIVYDGRNEDEEVDTRYKVTQEFIDELNQWRNDNRLDPEIDFLYAFVDGNKIQKLPIIVNIWWVTPDNPTENNNRLIAIIQWLNGENVFEVEEPHKFVVRSEHTDGDDNYKYVKIFNHVASPSYFDYATKFDTREEAQEWANSHQVVVEIDEDGNEVE